jgi:tetratricopeptide (TPR) repeat protein
MHLIRALFGARRPGQAYDQARQILQTPPKSPETLMALGRLLLAHLFYEDATTAFRLALTVAPASFEARFFHGLALHLVERHAEAVQVLEPLESSGNGEAVSLLAAARAGAGRLPEAVAGLRRAVAQAPSSPHAWINLALVLLDSGERSEAEALLRRFASMDGAGSAKVFYVSRRRSCEFELPSVPAREPAAPALFYDLALVFQSRYHHGSAVELLLLARQAEGDTARVLHAIGVSCLNLDPTSEQPVRLLRSALEKAPENHETHFMLGRAHSRRAERESAIARFRRAVELNNCAKYNTALGQELDLSGYAEPAIAALTRATELDGTDPEALVGLGRVLMRVGRSADAVRYLARAVAAEPDREEALYLLGMAHRRMGNPARAEAFMERFRLAKLATQRRSSLHSGFISGR